jgi:hypothetical protein
MTAAKDAYKVTKVKIADKMRTSTMNKFRSLLRKYPDNIVQLSDEPDFYTSSEHQLVIGDIVHLSLMHKFENCYMSRSKEEAFLAKLVALSSLLEEGYEVCFHFNEPGVKKRIKDGTLKSKEMNSLLKSITWTVPDKDTVGIIGGVIPNNNPGIKGAVYGYTVVWNKIQPNHSLGARHQPYMSSSTVGGSYYTFAPQGMGVSRCIKRKYLFKSKMPT